MPAAVWVLEGGQPRRADSTGVSLRDEDAWTGELMAIVEQTDSDESVAEAVVVEDEGERQHVVQNGTASTANSTVNSTANGAVNGAGSSKLKPFAPQPKAEPLVQKPQPPSPFADTTDTQPPALITTPKVEQVLPDPEPVVVPKAEKTEDDKPAADQPEPTALEKKRMRAYALLSDWPAGRERTAKTLADAIASSEPMAARFIEQYETEHGVVFASQN